MTATVTAGDCGGETKDCSGEADVIVLAFDVGRKKTGVAVGNILSGAARPLLAISGGRSEQLRAAAEQIAQWRPCRLVVGLPARMNGEEHAMTKTARAFARALSASHPNLPVTLTDERLTTAAARTQPNNNGNGNNNCNNKNKTPGKKNNPANPPDPQAAAIILQDWLDNTPP